jgi:hypothetical protein
MIAEVAAIEADSETSVVRDGLKVLILAESSDDIFLLCRHCWIRSGSTRILQRTAGRNYIVVKSEGGFTEWVDGVGQPCLSAENDRKTPGARAFVGR